MEDLTCGEGHQYIAGLNSSTLDLSLQVNGKMIVMEAEEVKINLASNMSIIELLAVINKKVEERDGKERI